MVWWGFHHYPHLEQVQDLRHISMGYKMKLYFQTNPYFTNMVIVKEFQCNRSGRLVSHSTPIRWHRGQEPQADQHRNQDTNHSFFSWFSNHSLPEANRIAEVEPPTSITRENLTRLASGYLGNWGCSLGLVLKALFFILLSLSTDYQE